MSGSGRFKPGEGDWICADPKCGNVNFSKRTQCNKCGKTERSEGQDIKKGGTEIGKMMADKSKGLFSADDWQCKTCGNVNWARRMSCNMCNTPKIGKQEARTGYGGGYMERDEVVEYKERADSDDEYDEFGRKKKKFRGAVPEVPSVVKQNVVVDEEEEDDDDEDVSKYKLDSDEEDDSEEGDLSKYDLVDSDEDDSKKIKRNDSASRDDSYSSSSSSSSYSSRSRSRSRSRGGSRSSSRSRSRSNSRYNERKRRSRQSRSRSHSRSRDRDRRRHSYRHSRSYSRSWSRSRSRSRDRSSRNHNRKRRRSRSRS